MGSSYGVCGRITTGRGYDRRCEEQADSASFYQSRVSTVQSTKKLIALIVDEAHCKHSDRLFVCYKNS